MKIVSRSIRSIVAGLVLACSPLTLTAAFAKDQLVVDLVNEPSSLDPHKQWNPDSYYVYRNVFDNLVTRNDAGEIGPQIATQWKYNSDAEIVFDLRDDVKFHDGTPLTAKDVAFSINRIINPAFASPQLSQFNKIVSAAATGDHQVTVKTNGAYPALLAQLVKLSIVPQHVVEAKGDDGFNAAPVGSGPYKFVNWQRGVSVTLERNDGYWGEKGAFKTAEFRAVPDAATRIANLQAGTTDLAVGLDADLAAQIENSATAKPLSVLTERVGYVKLNPNLPPFDDKRVREAVAHAIDKEAITQGLLGGVDKPVDQMVTTSHFGYVDGIKGYAYDPEKAKELVKEAGATGKAVSFATAPAFDQRIVQAIAQMIGDTGLTVNIEMTDMATYLKRAQSEPKSQPSIAFGRWSCACQDADGVLFPLLHSSSSWSSTANSQINATLEDARGTLDEKKRLEDYKTVSTFIAEDVPLVPVYQAAIIYGAAKQLEWKPTANESLFLNRMQWKD
ncbi:ABC transporter substrate-binding protein [Ochrobactrum teleogrylli]|uniref:ABC transporter substrate-binding protein n=1 Tax=Ochrobactrum teleogrylli TaxID=2479765 RepID=UPI00384BB349